MSPAPEIPPSAARKLRDLVANAAEFVPLYQHLWRQAGVSVSRLRLPAELSALPVLIKADLVSRQPLERLDRRFQGSRLIKRTTSGSTGQPLELLVDPATARTLQMRFLRGLWAVGYRPGQRLMLISSRPAHAVKRVSPLAGLIRWTYADLYLGEDELVEIYRRTRPNVLYGPVSALLSLVHAEGGSRSAHTPQRIISTGELLSATTRRQLATYFGVDVTDFYGMTEVGLVAWRAPGNDRYTASGAFILEFLPSSDLPGYDRLVLTDLQGGSMPLIRYDTGDLVRRDTTVPGAPIVELSGKQYDFLWLPDGRRISPYQVDRVLGERDGVDRYQVVQQPDMTLKVRLATRNSDVARQAIDELAALCEGRLPIHLEDFSELESSPVVHKLRPVQSLVRGVAG